MVGADNWHDGWSIGLKFGVVEGSMDQSYDYDVIVIGAGIAGMVSAVTAHGLGKRVAVVEKRKVGGNCTNYTCIPSKTLIRLSHTNREISRLASLGLLAGDRPTVDSRKVMAHIRSVVKRAYEKDVPETFEQIGITMVSGAAAFVDRHHIEVNGRTLSAKSFIIAVGTRPLIPPIAGISDIDYLTNETLYDLDDLPKSLIILGGGVDGLEYGSAFGRLGVEVSVVEMGERLLPGADRELVNHLLRDLQTDGIRLMPGTKAKSLRNQQGKVVLAYEKADGSAGEVQADRVLVALGRRPDLDELALDKAGVNCTPRGVITDQTLRTSAPNIYACGDIAGPDQLATMAEYQGIVAATNAILPVKQKVDYRNSVYVIFTEPTLAFLGLTEAKAHAKHGHKLKVYRFEYASMRRALIDGTTTGLSKFLCDGSGRLIGAHILGEAAAEVIHEAQVIKASGKPLHKFNLVTHSYPTYAQALVGRASQLAFLDKMGSSFLVDTALRVFPGLENKLNLARDRLAEKHPAWSENRTARIDVVLEAETSPPEHIGMKAVYLNEKAAVIDLPEDLMDHDERPLIAACAWNRATDPQNSILNCERVRSINGLGASMLVKLSAHTTNKGQNLSAFGVGKDLREIFRVTELDQAIQIHASQTDALSAAGWPRERSPAREEQQPCILTNLTSWAKPASELFVPQMPKEARNLNVNGLRAVGPVNGFGQLCQKVFRLHIKHPAITPEQAVAALKENFPSFQPPFNRFYPSPGGIQAGEVILIDSITPGGPVSTGVMVMYADDRSFTFNTPQGHPECGFVSFSGHEGSSGTIVQILGLARAGDPVYEAAFRLIGSRIQTRIWTHVLTSLAVHLGVPADITFEQHCLDKGLRWSQAANVYYNAQIRTLIHEPKRWFRKK
jgi:pyruvate/2-oxoglutarate dehydrogenase complex dihydrolipoamide dehydrogenase (E3) component/anti-anti-sigma regulatory factor